MAISKLSSPKWILLDSSSPTSGSSVSFTSLNPYKKYKLVYFNVDVSSAAVEFTLRLNNDSGSNYSYASLSGSAVDSAGVASSILLGQGGGSYSTDHSGVVDINYADELAKEITFWHSLGTPLGSGTGDRNNGNAFWNSQDTINRVDLILSSADFSSGSVKIYGRN